MASKKLHIFKRPKLQTPRMIIGLDGWMDNGDISTGVLKYLIQKLEAEKFAEIEPEDFYIYSFPGPADMATLFRPNTKIDDGLIKEFHKPENAFFYCEKNNLILFLGKEPNLHWEAFGECFFSVCSEFGVSDIYFIGSVAGLVPHTREPHFFCSVSDANLKTTLGHYGFKFSRYEGPASIITYLMVNAVRQDLNIASLIAAIPVYIQGNNPKCIEASVKTLGVLLDLHLNHDDLQQISSRFEKKLTDTLKEQPELAAAIQKLEEDYDNEVFNNEMGELKMWLEQQGIRVD